MEFVGPFTSGIAGRHCNHENTSWDQKFANICDIGGIILKAGALERGFTVVTFLDFCVVIYVITSWRNYQIL